MPTPVPTQADEAAAPAADASSIDASLSAAQAPVTGTVTGSTNSSITTDENRSSANSVADKYAALGLGVPKPAAPTTAKKSAALPAPATGATAGGAPADVPATSAGADPAQAASQQAPATASPAPAPSPTTAPLTRTRSTRAATAAAAAAATTANSAADDSPSPAPRPKRGKAAAAKSGDTPTPRADALQAGIDSAGNRLAADEAQLSELQIELNSHRARTKVQHDLITKQVGAINKETAAANLKHTILQREFDVLSKALADARKRESTSRADIDRLIDKFRIMDGIVSGLRATAESAGVSAFAPDFMDALDAGMAQLRQQIDETLDTVSNLRARLDAQDTEIAAARQNAADANAMAARALEEVRRLAASNGSRDAATGVSITQDRTRRFSANADLGILRPPPPPPPPAAGAVRRRGSLSGSDSEDTRTLKAPRVTRDDADQDQDDRWYDRVGENPAREPSFEGYHSYGSRRDARDAGRYTDAGANRDGARPGSPADPAISNIPATYRSARMGTGANVQAINWGRRNDPQAAVNRVGHWTQHMDNTGAIPIPTHAAAPPGMADNYRLITFHTHADLVLFLTAWQNRPEELRAVIATPVPENAGPVANPSAALGLLPPGTNNTTGGRRPSGNKDSYGRRRF